MICFAFREGVFGRVLLMRTFLTSLIPLLFAMQSVVGMR
jgi:hypothetical protein